MLVKLFVPIQLDVMSVGFVVLANSSNHQTVMSVTLTVLTNLSKHLMLLNLSVPVMQVILSFVIPLKSLSLIERLVNNKSSRQHDFTKPFSAVNILLMSIYFYDLVLLFFIFYHNFCNNNVDNFFKCYARCNNFSTNKFLTSNSVAIFNISDKNALNQLSAFLSF